MKFIFLFQSLILSLIYQTNKNNLKLKTMKQEKKIYWNLRKFEVDFAFNGDLNLADIKENGVTVWTIFANTEKSLKSQVTKWCKNNW